MKRVSFAECAETKKCRTNTYAPTKNTAQVLSSRKFTPPAIVNLVNMCLRKWKPFVQVARASHSLLTPTKMKDASVCKFMYAMPVVLLRGHHIFLSVLSSSVRRQVLEEVLSRSLQF